MDSGCESRWRVVLNLQSTAVEPGLPLLKALQDWDAHPLSFFHALSNKSNTQGLGHLLGLQALWAGISNVHLNRSDAVAKVKYHIYTVIFYEMDRMFQRWGRERKLFHLFGNSGIPGSREEPARRLLSKFIRAGHKYHSLCWDHLQNPGSVVLLPQSIGDTVSVQLALEIPS